MNTQTKWLFAVLLFLLLFFAVSIVRFYTDKTALDIGSGDLLLSETLPQDTAQYRIFESETGTYGLEDADGKTVIAPEWENLYFIGDNCIAAVKKIGSERVTGVLDTEGNVIAPFVYRDLSYVNAEIIVGSLLHDDMYFLYNQQFQALTPCAWNAYMLNGALLTLQRGTDAFTYRLSGSTLYLRSLDLQRSIQRRTVTMHCAQGQMARMLSVEEWCALGDMLTEYLKAYYRGVPEDAAHLMTEEALDVAQMVFTTDAEARWQPVWIEKILLTGQQDVLGTTIFCDITVAQEQETAILQVVLEKESATGELHITGMQIIQETV